MQLDKALAQLSEIHAQVLRSEVFRGFRSLPLALTGLVAAAAATAQSMCSAPREGRDFVIDWLVVAGICAAICGVDLVRVWLQHRSPRGTWMVVAQFVPAVLVGALLAVVFARPERDALWLLPGLWAIVFGLGIFASRPYLPRAIGWVAAWYVLAGGVQLLVADGGEPGPWSMGITFGIGQTAAAVVLHLDLERTSHGL